MRRVLIPVALTLVASLATAVTESDATASRAENVIVRHVRVDAPDAANADHASKVVVVRTRAATGEAPTEEISWLGSEGGELRTVDASTLAVGERRLLSDEGGKKVEMVRTESGLVLEIDGEAIALPGIAGDGADLRVLAGVGAHAGAHFIADDGTVTNLGPGVACTKRVVVIKDGEEAAPGAAGHHAIVMRAASPHLLFAPSHVDFDSLESLKGLDAATRDKVIAALKEILAKPTLMDLDVNVNVTTDGDAPADPDHERLVWQEKPEVKIQ